MFLFHIAFALGLMAITGGVFLYLWSQSMKAKGAGLAKLIGALVIIFGLLSTICTSYCQIQLWRNGFYANMMETHAMMTGKENAMMGAMDEKAKKEEKRAERHHKQS